MRWQSEKRSRMVPKEQDRSSTTSTAACLTTPLTTLSGLLYPCGRANSQWRTMCDSWACHPRLSTLAYITTTSRVCHIHCSAWICKTTEASNGGLLLSQMSVCPGSMLSMMLVQQCSRYSRKARQSGLVIGQYLTAFSRWWMGC